MRKLSQSLGLGLLSSLFLVIPACGDDGGGDTGANSTGHNTGTHGHLTHGNHTGSQGTLTTAGTGTQGTGGTSPTTGAATGTGGTSPTTGAATTGGTGTGTSGGTGGDTTGDEAAGKAAVKSLLNELCKWSQRCCDSGEFSYIFGYWTADVDACTDHLYAAYLGNDSDSPDSKRLAEVHGTAASLMYNVAYQVSSIRTTPVKAEVDRCTAYVKELTCNSPLEDKRCTPVQDEAKVPCRLVDMFTGKLELGQLCNANLVTADKDIECKPGSSCGQDPNSAGGNNSHICIVKGLENQSCSPGADHSDDENTCEFGLYCDAGKCKKRPTLGQPCSYKDASKVEAGQEEVPCAAPYSCDPISNKCVQACSAGERCSNDDNACPTGQSCLPYYHGGAVTGTQTFCGDLLGYGGRCNTQADCQPGLHCNLEWDATNNKFMDNGRCEDDLKKDVACNFDFQCGPARFCDNGQADDAGAPPATPGSCQGLLGSDAADDGKCADDGHRACFASAKGCFKGKGGTYRCMGGAISEGHDCDVADSDGLGTFDYLSDVANWARVNPPGDAWNNNCVTGICELNTAATPAATQCRVGLAEGATGCDYDTKDSAKLTCRPGLICVANTCQKPIATGAGCNLNFNKPAADGGAKPRGAGGGGNDPFSANLCNPDSSCKQVGENTVCSVVSASKRTNACIGGGTTPG